MLTDEWLLRFLALAIILSLYFLPSKSKSDEWKPHTIQQIIESGVLKFTADAPARHKYTRANSYQVAGWIIKGAQIEGVNPFEVLGMAIKESSMRSEAVGAAGETGIAQYMPGGYLEGYVLKHLSAYYGRSINAQEVQSGAMAYHALAAGLRKCQEICPEHYLSYYNSGMCRKVTYEQRVQRIIKKLFH